MACERCGCEGIHACIGHKPAPWTDEEKAKFREALEKVAAAQIPLDAEFSRVLHEEAWGLYARDDQTDNSKVKGD